MKPRTKKNSRNKIKPRRQKSRHSNPRRHLLSFQMLEDRRLLAALTVNSFADNTTDDAVLTLRESILLVNNGGDANVALGRALSTGEAAQVNTSEAFGTNDTITFSSLFETAQAIGLNSQLPTITDAVTITGPGADLLTLDAGNGTDSIFDTNDGFRIFDINDGTNALIDVALSGLTLTGGDVSNNGGAIRNRENLTITSSTLSGNSADFGGGIAIAVLSTATITNSIVANSPSGGDVSVLDDGTLSGSNNLIEDGSGGLADSITGDPLLGPLADNGGPTLTHALLAGSPAIDAGDPALVGGGFDQRGAPFLRDDGNGIDIGAYERQTLSLVVDTTADENDGDFSEGDLSLREAIGLANDNVGADTITFSSLFDAAQTIGLNSQLPTIIDAVTITGPGADLLTLDAGNGTDSIFDTDDGFRIFDINDGTNALIDVALSGLTLTGGDVSNSGGAIRNSENLTITSSTLSGNSANTCLLYTSPSPRD